MKPESLVFAASGALFGIIAGWILGAQQASIRPQAVAAPAAESQPAPAAGQTAQAPPQLDQVEVDRLLKVAAADPAGAGPRVAIANLYFDSEHYQEAAQWYEAALKLKPDDADVSTDLGVSYYYLNQPDRALAQFDQSLRIDSKHTKTLLNVGIVRAFGKQDLAGAAKAWEQVLALAPDSPEGKAAKRALDAMKGAHPNLPGSSAPASQAPGTN
jgi:tetratricopeptide (TPR) repeat protein